MIHILDRKEKDGTRFHHITENNMQLKTYKLFIPGIFYLMFPDWGWPQVIKISENNTCTAYFHKEFNSVLIINNQGSIDNIIYLFDRFIKNPNKSNIITRLEALVEAYFSNEMNDFINILYKSVDIKI